MRWSQREYKREYKRVEVPFPVTEHWAINSNNYSERKALEERKWLAVISSFIIQNAIFRQLTIVCCLRICLSAWKSQQTSFVLRVKAHNVTVSHSLDKRKSLFSVLCFSAAWGRPPLCQDSQMIVWCWQTPWKLDRVQTLYAFILSSRQSSGKPYRRPTESLGGWLLAGWQPGPQKKKPHRSLTTKTYSFVLDKLEHFESDVSVAQSVQIIWTGAARSCSLESQVYVLIPVDLARVHVAVVCSFHLYIDGSPCNKFVQHATVGSICCIFSRQS